MKRFVACLISSLFIMAPSVVVAQKALAKPANRNMHIVFVEALSVNYSFYHKQQTNKSLLGFGITAGMGWRFPLVNSTFRIDFQDGTTGTTTLKAQGNYYIEVLKVQLIAAWPIHDKLLVQISSFASCGYFGDIIESWNIGAEGALLYSYRKLYAGIKIQSGMYTRKEHHFYPLLLMPTIGIKLNKN